MHILCTETPQQDVYVWCAGIPSGALELPIWPNFLFFITLNANSGNGLDGAGAGDGVICLPPRTLSLFYCFAEPKGETGEPFRVKVKMNYV